MYTGTERRQWWSAYKEDIGRPFFVCGNGTERDPEGCGYFEWGDKNIVTMPLCYHGSICRVKGKAGERSILGCAAKDCPCNYFEWGTPPNEDPASKKRRLERMSRLSEEERENPWLTYCVWGDPPNEDPASKKRRLERLSRLSKEETLDLPIEKKIGKVVTSERRGKEKTLDLATK